MSVAQPHQRADPPLVPGRAASPARAIRAPQGQLLFQDHPYPGPVSVNPVISVQSQPPVMVSSQEQNNFAAASGPARVTTVYQKDEYGCFVPLSR